MTKQEEMHWDTALARIIIESELLPPKTPYWKVVELAKSILKYQNSQGVVIKVKCPDCEWSQFVDEESVGMTPCYSCDSTGYLVEPLIKEVSNV